MDTQKNKSNFSFIPPTLVESIFIENPEYKGDFCSVKNLKFNLNTSVEKPEKNPANSDQNQAVVMLTLATANDLEFTENDACYLRITMKSKFVWQKDSDNDNEVDSLLKINAPSLLLSYIRPQVVSLTENSDIPTQHVPFIDFSQNIFKDKN